MNRYSANRFTLGACAAAAILTACGGSQPPIASSPTTMPQSLARPNYRTLYSFGKRFSGGRVPKSALLDVNGTLYGTTFAGGSTKCIGGCGIVFTITPSGKEKVLYRFRGGNDGANPSASLLAVKGLLYGTTEYGGGQVDGGTVFEVSTTGIEKVLHRFGYDGDERYSNDGLNPVASLIAVKGELYGTTLNGGTSGSGTVFRINTRGKEQVLHSFGLSGDGANPVANLTDVTDTLYGTTQLGGTGYGTVFSVSTTGIEKVVHEFGDGPYGSGSGAYPDAGLISVSGTLYGTTAYGRRPGWDRLQHHDRAARSRTYIALTVGWYPYAPLLTCEGFLYGTTSSGGASGKGMIFGMSLTGMGEGSPSVSATVLTARHPLRVWSMSMERYTAPRQRAARTARELFSRLRRSELRSRRSNRQSRAVRERAGAGCLVLDCYHMGLSALRRTLQPAEAFILHEVCL